MSNSILQVRVEEELKSESMKICSNLGIDLSTAVRMFLKRMVKENGLPFSTNLSEESYNKSLIKVVEKVVDRK